MHPFFVCDEIYAVTVFSTPRIVSVAKVIEEMECNLDLIHIICGFSNDMGFPGFRVGIVYSFINVAMSCGRKMSSFGLVSSQTQHLLAAMLSDDGFMDKFLKESSKRLAQRHEIFTKGLEKVGITCLPSNAELFCWMGLRSLLKGQTFEAEMAQWRMIIDDVKLNVSLGSSFHCIEPGWFRVCFANMEYETVEVALKRIRAFVGKETEKPANVNRRWQSNLQLSFITKSFEEAIMSPRLVSPNSPMPHFPLVQAT